MSHAGTDVRQYARPGLFGAVASLLLGLLALVALSGIVAGLPALVLGFLSLRRLNAAGATSVWGSRCAVAGMVLGTAGTVLGVIGILAIVLGQLGEQSRRANCTNNLRQIGRAVLEYNDVNKHFPTATVHPPGALAAFAPWRNPPYVKRLSWLVELLPYLGRPTESTPDRKPLGQVPVGGKFEALFQRFNPSKPWDAPVNAEPGGTEVRLFLCPSSPRPDGKEKLAPTDYVGIAGIGPDAAFLPKDSPRAGFFGYERRLHIDRRMGSNDLPAGTSHTMLCVETTRDVGPWVAGNGSTVRSLDPTDLPYIGPGRQFGGCHPGGANLLKVDGSVEFFNEAGSPTVFERLAVVGDW